MVPLFNKWCNLTIHPKKQLPVFLSLRFINENKTEACLRLRNFVEVKCAQMQVWRRTYNAHKRIVTQSVLYLSSDFFMLAKTLIFSNLIIQ